MSNGVGGASITGNHLDDDFLAAARSFWHPIARGTDVVAGEVMPVTLLDEELAVWRGPSGELGLVDDLCSHRGTRLSLGEVADSSYIVCPYHAWEFDRTGECRRIPQLQDRSIPDAAGVGAYRVAEQSGLVWACLAGADESDREIPDFAEAQDPDWRLVVGEPMDWSCQATRQIENFLDMAHFSVVHVDVFGNPDVMEVPAYEVTGSAKAGTLATATTYPALDLMASAETGTVVESPIDFRYSVRLPFVVLLGSTLMGVRYTLLCATQPISADRCRVYWCFALPADEGAELSDDMIRAGEEMVFSADRRIIETQRPQRVPLDASAEFHLSFDRMAVAYRRALRELEFPTEI